MVAAAQGLQEAGAFGLVLECIPDQLAGIITETLSIPTIGIGAGAQCDGQVLVTHDLLGMFDKFIPSFVKSYTRLSPLIKENVTRYAEEVRTGAFPDEAHSFTTQLDLGKLLDKP
jgi:3-methyl-2-oxobutanoate hydroxymethyltransferase